MAWSLHECDLILWVLIIATEPLQTDMQPQYIVLHAPTVSTLVINPNLYGGGPLS